MPYRRRRYNRAYGSPGVNPRPRFSNWIRHEDIFSTNISSVQTGAVQSKSFRFEAQQGTAGIKMRRLSVNLCTWLDADSPNATNYAGACQAELIIGQATDQNTFNNMVNNANVRLPVRRKICVALNRPETVHIWLPRGFNINQRTTAQGEEVIYFGVRVVQAQLNLSQFDLNNLWHITGEFQGLEQQIV